MNRDQKEALISEFQQKFSEAKAAILTDPSGLSVEDITELRKKLRPTHCELKVMKNTLAKRALAGTVYQEVESHFQGPVAVAFGFGDPVASTKVLFKFSETQKKLKIKIGVIEGNVLDVKGIQTVASLPSREALLGNLLRGLQSPLYGLVGTLNQILQKFAYVLSAVKDKKEGSDQ